MTTTETVTVNFTVNGEPVSATVEPRRSLVDCLRDDLHFHGTHIGCEHGVCGCCNIMLDGKLVRSCLMFAYQADGSEIKTIEGVEGPEGEMSPLQEAFCEHHSMQCGYCTPGMILAIENLIAENPAPNEEDLIEAVSANLCRCTGYQQILDAAKSIIPSIPNSEPAHH